MLNLKFKNHMKVGRYNSGPKTIEDKRYRKWEGIEQGVWIFRYTKEIKGWDPLYNMLTTVKNNAINILQF